MSNSPAKSWAPCGVAGTKLKVGGGGASTTVGEVTVGWGLALTMVGASAGAGAVADSATPSIWSSWGASDGVVEVLANAADSSSSSSMGRKREMAGDGARMGIFRGGGAASSMRLVSGTSRSRSSMLIRPRNDSSAPVNRSTWPSMVSIRWLVRMLNSATLSKVAMRASSTAIRSACSVLTSETK